MSRIWILAALLAAALALRPALAEGEAGPRIHGGYVTGFQYWDMPGLQKKAYVAGLLDGMLLAPAFGAREPAMRWFLDCTEAIGVIKIRAALIDYIKSHDETLDNKNAAKMYRAIRHACRDFVKDGPKDGPAGGRH